MIEGPMDYVMTVNDDMLLARVNTVESARYRQSKELGKLNNVVKRYKDENAKLREYTKLYFKAVKCDGCEWCPYDINLACDTETIPMHEGCKLYNELRELGIEVD